MQRRQFFKISAGVAFSLSSLPMTAIAAEKSDVRSNVLVLGGRHSGVVPQRAHGRAGKAAGAAVCQSEKAALGQGAPPAELSAHPAGGGAGAGAGPDAADPGAGAVLPQPVSAN